MKTFISTLIIVLSCVCESASVWWNSGSPTDGFKAPDGSTINSSMGYVVNVYFYSDEGGKNLLNDSPSSSGTISPFDDSIGTTTPADYYDFTAKESYYVKAIIENDSYSRETAVLSFVVPDSGNAVLNFMTGGNLTNPSGGSNTWGDWTTKGGDVPEPTTCSLLLVGLAGMGLKRLRKRNKTA